MLLHDPRLHTSAGYFCRKTSKDWHPLVAGGGNGFRRSECDDALRWRYIQSTQNGFCNDAQANKIAALCKLWNQLRFALPGGNDILLTAETINSMSPSDLDVLNKRIRVHGFSDIHICEDYHVTGCKCSECSGSQCCLAKVVAKVAGEMEQIICLAKDPCEDNEDPALLALTELCECKCNDGVIFEQRHSTMLKKLERQFRSFPSKNCRELLHWFISKHMHGHNILFIKHPDFDPNEEISKENFPFESFGGLYCSNKFRGTHNDCGDLTYQEGAKGCKYHGL